MKFTACCDYRGALPPGKIAWSDAPVIIDEASMLPTWMVAKLRSMCAQLILVGDPHQLPPVNDRINPAGYFNSRQHDSRLTKIHRQGAGSPILQLATEIRSKSPNAAPRIKTFKPQLDFEDAVGGGYQFIAFTNRERQRINFITRERLGFQGILPQPGDRLISTSNFDEDLINGTPVTCRAFDWDGISRLASIEVEDNGVTHTIHCDMPVFLRDQVASATLPFKRMLQQSQEEKKELPEPAWTFTYGYCLTAHKAQGSEYPKVCVIDQRNVIMSVAESEKQAGRETLTGDEYARRWLYTAVTRAKESLVIANPWWAVLAEEEFLA